MTDNRRTNLHLYYKIVKKCKLCNINYGIDENRESPFGKDKCPICTGDLKKKYYTVGTKEQGGSS